MLKAKIIGACGYGGVGMVELLLRHPHAQIVSLIDIENVGEPVSTIYPHLRGFCDMTIIASSDEDPADGRANAVFIATPDGVGMSLAPGYVANQVAVVDYSGDFRFSQKDIYKRYAQRIKKEGAHKSPELLPFSVYGLAELHREEIKKAKVVGNPGCFAVASILGVAPAVKAGIINTECIIFDAKTGVSGAGKKPSSTFHYPARYEAMNAYKIGQHQHEIEIEHELGKLAKREVAISLTTQVVPLSRGIMVCCYAELDEGWIEVNKIHHIYTDFYKNERFIDVLSIGNPGNSIGVRGSNCCHLSVNVNTKTGRLICISYIDNLLKGQAGSALQNMNLLLGIEEISGLLYPGMVP
ncbi:MAG: N-acetyl-gamma-glutamyl-phosphate reductase [bacterium]